MNIKSTKKNIIILVISLVLLFILYIGYSYFVWNIENCGSGSGMGTPLNGQSEMIAHHTTPAICHTTLFAITDPEYNSL